MHIFNLAVYWGGCRTHFSTLVH